MIQMVCDDLWQQKQAHRGAACPLGEMIQPPVGPRRAGPVFCQVNPTALLSIHNAKTARPVLSGQRLQVQTLRQPQAPSSALPIARVSGDKRPCSNLQPIALASTRREKILRLLWWRSVAPCQARPSRCAAGGRCRHNPRIASRSELWRAFLPRPGMVLNLK